MAESSCEILLLQKVSARKAVLWSGRRTMDKTCEDVDGEFLYYTLHITDDRTWSVGLLKPACTHNGSLSPRGSFKCTRSNTQHHVVTQEDF